MERAGKVVARAARHDVKRRIPVAKLPGRFADGAVPADTDNGLAPGFHGGARLPCRVAVA